MIDGYNVIHADDGLRRAADRSLEGARRALLERLAGYVSSRRVRVTVVFDGAGMVTDSDVAVPGRLQVVFSASGQSADEVIVETLERSRNPREYIVVSSDMADIGRSVRSMGATLMPSEAFLERIAAPSRPGDDAPAGGGADAGYDVDFWLAEFERRGKTRRDE